MKLGIFGRGFGLYGYAVAASKNNFQVLIPEHYRETIDSRIELKLELGRVRYLESQEEIFQESDAIVVALSPRSQVDFLLNNSFVNKRIFLEKPLAHSLSDHQRILSLLKDLDYNFSIGYLFKFTNWGSLVLLDSKEGLVKDFDVNWRIPKPNSKWKMNSFLGGGIVKFYAIHFLKLALELGYDLTDLVIKHDCNVLSLVGSNFNVQIDIVENGIPRFYAYWQLENIQRKFQLETPFGQTAVVDVVDPRVEFLSEYLLYRNNKVENIDHEEKIFSFLKGLET